MSRQDLGRGIASAPRRRKYGPAEARSRLDPAISNNCALHPGGLSFDGQAASATAHPAGRRRPRRCQRTGGRRGASAGCASHPRPVSARAAPGGHPQAVMVTVSEKVLGSAGSPEIQTDGTRAATGLPQPLEALADAPGYCDFPCSVAQERFFLLDRLEPGNPAYNVAVRWQLEGTLETALLEQAWNEILARHEILRTRFLEIDGKPVQRVTAQAQLKISEIDLESLAPEARAAEGDRIGLIEARAPF